MRQVTFIPTTSLDGTADLVVSRLGPEAVFRFNFDLWRDYDWRIDADGFSLSNPLGRRLTADTVAKVYWRKPQPTAKLFPDHPLPADVRYQEAELWYALREMVNGLRGQGRVVLVEPGAENRVGKFTQMAAARRRFRVPAWRFARGGAAGEGAAVAKSLTLARVDTAKVLYATRVAAEQLDPAAPWFLSEYIPALYDVTVVFVRGRLFAFEFPRRFLDRAIDWRVVALEPGAEWRPHALPLAVERAVAALMAELRLDYGRLDFLLTEAGEYVFLEVNPNGEWGWLDKDGDHGVLAAILAEVAPDTPRHPLPAA